MKLDWLTILCKCCSVLISVRWKIAWRHVAYIRSSTSPALFFKVDELCSEKTKYCFIITDRIENITGRYGGKAMSDGVVFINNLRSKFISLLIGKLLSQCDVVDRLSVSGLLMRFSLDKKVRCSIHGGFFWAQLNGLLAYLYSEPKCLITKVWRPSVWSDAHTLIIPSNLPTFIILKAAAEPRVIGAVFLYWAQIIVNISSITWHPLLIRRSVLAHR